jgi:GTP-binding protein
MKFVDHGRIYVQAGDGADGCLSFRREKYVPRGGPDGGDGGKGGDVILVASSQLQTLLDFKYHHHFRAKKGGNGGGKNKHGKDAPNLIIHVPCGTLIFDAETETLLEDLVEEGQRFVVVRGGRGGKGNARFATSTNQAPRKITRGRTGEERWLKLELKLLADVGLIGFPNAGKSTFLSRVTSARPRIASYPFTTLEPNLGVVQNDEEEHFLMADIPGLLEGAHSGVGLGIRFLRHIERTRILVHLIDLGINPGREPLKDFRIINEELKQYSPSLAARPQIIALNKIDLPETRERIERFRTDFESKGMNVFAVSAMTGEGVKALIEYLFNAISDLKEEKGEVLS